MLSPVHASNVYAALEATTVPVAIVTPFTWALTADPSHPSPKESDIKMLYEQHWAFKMFTFKSDKHVISILLNPSRTFKREKFDCIWVLLIMVYNTRWKLRKKQLMNQYHFVYVDNWIDIQNQGTIQEGP